ncbi:MAG: tetratricopeptide repeat protein, partial [Blastocatellia bacterium]|nr:tetratricopeptide repeat protein [Blastocatellia bacterium]
MLKRRVLLYNLLTVGLAVAISMASGCRSGNGLPEKNSDEYRNAISAFYVGLAALQAGDDSRAQQKLAEVTALAPGEPAAWFNLGLLALRQRDFDLAADRLEHARSLAPNNGNVYVLLGFLESSRGRFDQAQENFRRAIELDSENLRARSALAQEI